MLQYTIMKLCLGLRFQNYGVCPPPLRRGVAVGLLGAVQVVRMRDIFILKEIWPQDKIYILVGTLLG
jgi:hypothetical protein